MHEIVLLGDKNDSLTLQEAAALYPSQLKCGMAPNLHSCNSSLPVWKLWNVSLTRQVAGLESWWPELEQRPYSGVSAPWMQLCTHEPEKADPHRLYILGGFAVCLLVLSAVFCKTSETIQNCVSLLDFRDSEPLSVAERQPVGACRYRAAVVNLLCCLRRQPADNGRAAGVLIL